MNPSLPPFGIRHLYAEEPFSVLQVTGDEYQSTINSHPDAALSYIDEDDGENVVVGSSLELRQRLGDPVPHTAPRLYCYDASKDASEDRYIHLFDIQRTGASRTVWREHQAYYTKSKKQYERACEEADEADSISSIDINATDPAKEFERGDVEHTQPQHRNEDETPSKEDASVSLADAIPDLVENLANLLQVTSETLRKAAEKSRESNTSPIEDILSGVSNIVTEIGCFGLNLIDKLGEPTNAVTPDMETNLEAEVSNDDTKSMSSQMLATPIDGEEQNDAPQSFASAESSISSLPSGKHSQSQDEKDQNIPETKDVMCHFCSTRRLQCRESPDSSNACHNCATLGHPCSLNNGSSAKSPEERQDAYPSPIRITFNKEDGSILDQDTDDADFSRRYPPLMSLRRANTIAGMHDRFFESSNQDLGNETLGRHNSWIKRYPCRPIPQVLDDETQRRREFARNCFPTQKYTPGPGAQETNPLSRKRLAPKFGSMTDRDASERNDISAPPSQPPLTSAKSGLPKPEIIPKINDVVAVDKPSSILDSPAEQSKKSFPGGWPESPKGRLQPSAPPGESSGAFFHRMMRDNPSRKQHADTETNERLTRHRSFSKQRPSNNPFSDLNRSHTVSSATNPASRLNRPFDPYYPITATPGSSSSKAQPSNRDEALQYETSPAPRPAERPPWAQRSFSPVWEEHFNTAQSREKAKKAKFGTVDRNGESSSMYSPPPRHMRSVPNFATARSMAQADRPASVYADAHSTHVVQPSPPARPVSPFKSTVRGIVPTDLEVPQLPSQIRFMRERNNPFYPQTFGTGLNLAAPQSVVPATAPKPKVTFTTPNENLQKCINVLKDMGYGSDDDNLKSRLHVYAEAADGDVMEAVEMIEDDKKAHYDGL